MDSTMDKEDGQPLLPYGPKDIRTSKKFPKLTNSVLRRLHLAALYLYCIGVSAASYILLAQVKDPNVSVYSPVNTEISYLQRTFEPGTPDHPSRYQGEPNEMNNHLWDSLYRGARSTRITSGEAWKLVNTSNETSENNDEHIIQLEVFHQLHCLNTLRRTLWPDYFPKYSLTGPNGDRNMHRVLHADHCIDRLRLGVLCASNTGVLKWKRRPGTPTGKSFDERFVIDSRSTMMCRDFERIRDWASARQVHDSGWHE